MSKLKLGIIKEGKNPPDKRVPLTPLECKEISEKFPEVDLVVQPSQIRIFKDIEYQEQGITLQEDLSDCDVLIGVKEVPMDMLIPSKRYFFFSHTTKEQPYNQKLLQTILEKKVELIDWENLTNTKGSRVIAFGRYAGIVGAYNGILTYGKKHSLFDLKAANACFDMEEMQAEYAKVDLPNVKLVVTGNGRVSHGAMEVLNGMNIRKVSVEELLINSYDEAVYAQLKVDDYNKSLDGSVFDKKLFYSNPELFESNFTRFAEICDMMIAGAFWDPDAPKLFTKEDVKDPNFNMSVVADVTMDIDGSIATTQRPATIEEPAYDYVKETGELEPAYNAMDNVTVMAVDNLPCELPRDASRDFGREFIDNVLPNLLNGDPEKMIAHAAITNLNGELNKDFAYLKDYAAGTSLG